MGTLVHTFRSNGHKLNDVDLYAIATVFLINKRLYKKNVQL